LTSSDEGDGNDEPAGEWECYMCGLLNDEKEKVCSKCSNPRVAGLVEHDVVNGNDDDDSDDANRDDFAEEVENE
jgi:hypothetical protein